MSDIAGWIDVGPLSVMFAWYALVNTDWNWLLSATAFCLAATAMSPLKCSVHGYTTVIPT